MWGPHRQLQATDVRRRPATHRDSGSGNGSGSAGTELDDDGLAERRRRELSGVMTWRSSVLVPVQGRDGVGLEHEMEIEEGERWLTGVGEKNMARQWQDYCSDTRRGEPAGDGAASSGR
jgi:hypothetical protein